MEIILLVIVVVQWVFLIRLNSRLNQLEFDLEGERLIRAEGFQEVGQRMNRCK